MPLLGLRALRLVFVSSLLVSCVQILLYRTIVLRSKHAIESRYPWKQEKIEVVKDEFTGDSVRDEKSNHMPDKHKTTTTTTTTSTTTNAVVKHKACSFHGKMSENYHLANTSSDLSNWTYRRRLTCPSINVKQRQKTRLKLVLVCNKFEVFANFLHVNATDGVFKMRSDDKCLSTFVSQCCTDALPVPNVIHYVWYDKKKLSFFDFVSFISVIRFVRPCAIFIHGDSPPEGEYWDFIVNLYPNIVHVMRKVPKSLFGKEVKHKEHIGDVWRIKSLLKFGGIYMDTDTLLVKSIDPLRQFPYTMSKQTENMTISSAFIAAERNATFLNDWLSWYQIYYVNTSYTYNAMMYPNILSGRKPKNIHIEYGTVSRPTGQVGNIIFTSNIDWSNIFGMHLYAKSFRQNVEYVNENNVRNFNTTVGAMCRHILFGNKELCA